MNIQLFYFCRKAPCTPGEVFDFCWSLFVRVKADFPAISDDLVNSYHLLLSCVDYVYANAVLADRSDLLNDKTLKDSALPGESQTWGVVKKRPIVAGKFRSICNCSDCVCLALLSPDVKCWS